MLEENSKHEIKSVETGNENSENIEPNEENNFDERIQKKIIEITESLRRKIDSETGHDSSDHTEYATMKHMEELCNFDKMLRSEMPRIKEAIAAINIELSNYPMLIDILEKYLLDMTHSMNVAEYLKTPETRDVVIKHLKEIAEQPAISRNEFLKQIDEYFDPTQEFYMDTDSEFSKEEDGTSRLAVMKDLLMKENSELYGIGDNPTERELEVLNDHVRHMNEVILPKFQHHLTKLTDVFQDGAFPIMNSRVKSSGGMVDKVNRMRSGHDGKTPRKEYSMGDMPDAIGCRLTVTKLSQLQALMPMIEEEFGKENIYEKENFYSNERKRKRAFRAVAYTIMIDGVPCELQLTTLDSSLVGDIHHNIVYKDILPATDEDKDYCNELRRRTVIKECKEVA